MIPRYTNPEMGAIWSDQRRYETWLRGGARGGRRDGRGGHHSSGRGARVAREARPSTVARIDEIEQVTQHDVIAFTTAVAEQVGPAARWLHFGLTSSDVRRHRAGAPDA